MWGNPSLLKKGKIYWKKILRKINIDTINLNIVKINEKSFLIDPQTTNNVIYRESIKLTIKKIYKQ